MRSITLALAALLGALAACASPAAEPTPAPAETPAPAATRTPVSTSTPSPYDPNRIMYRLFPGFEQANDLTLLALEEVRQQRDTSQVPVLIEMMRFLPAASLMEATAEALRDLTGQQFTADQWNEWMEWYGKNRETYRPPPEYLDWKTSFMSQIDPRFSLFLRGAEEKARIDLTEVVWGGVVPDGIPDLNNPQHISPEQAAYLEPDEQVFGVSINGESRAYPLRIINAHEMVNDVLEGEPVSLSW